MARQSPLIEYSHAAELPPPSRRTSTFRRWYRPDATPSSSSRAASAAASTDIISPAIGAPSLTYSWSGKTLAVVGGDSKQVGEIVVSVKALDALRAMKG